jgi:hypothetical protein
MKHRPNTQRANKHTSATENNADITYAKLAQKLIQNSLQLRKKNNKFNITTLKTGKKN